jgi:hypothetical protein
MSKPIPEYSVDLPGKSLSDIGLENAVVGYQGEPRPVSGFYLVGEGSIIEQAIRFFRPYKLFANEDMMHRNMPIRLH